MADLEVSPGNLDSEPDYGQDPPTSCHCDSPVHTHANGFTRGLCQFCDSVRCDAFLGECGR